MRKTLLIIGGMLLAACSYNGADVSAPAASGETYSESGETAYLAHCAGCHETGLQGAPVVGDKADWEGRSKLWQAVMMDHAKTGYLDMPAKGGRPDLSDRTIEVAVEYMLERTYPDLPVSE